MRDAIVEALHRFAASIPPEAANAYAFGSLVRDDAMFFGTTSSDLDILVVLNGHGGDAPNRVEIARGLLTATADLEIALLRATRRTDAAKSMVSVAMVTQAEVASDVHKDGTNYFYRDNTFMPLVANGGAATSLTIPTSGDGAAALSDERRQVLRSVQKFRNAYLRTSANGTRATAPWDSDSDAAPKELLRAAALLRFACGGDQSNAADKTKIEEGLLHLTSMFDEPPLKTHPLTQKLLARLLRKSVRPLSEDEMLLVWEVLADGAVVERGARSGAPPDRPREPHEPLAGTETERVRSVFSPHSPIRKQELLFGREDEVIRLRDTLSQAGAHAIVTGQRGSGKTSLTRVTFPNAYYVQASQDEAHARFLNDISSEIFERHPDLTQTAPTVSRTMSTYSAGSVSFAQLLKVAGERDGRPPVVIVDEFERAVSDKANLAAFTTLAKLLSDVAGAALVFVGVDIFRRLLVESNQSLARAIAHELSIGPISDTSIANLIRHAERSVGTLRYTGDAVAAIVLASDGSPYLAHAIGLSACLIALDGKSESMALADVVEAVNTERATPHVFDLVTLISVHTRDRLRRRLVRTMAETAETRLVWTSASIAQQSAANSTETEHALRELVAARVLRHPLDPYGFACADQYSFEDNIRGLARFLIAHTQRMRDEG